LRKYNELKKFLASKTGLQMSHIYKPASNDISNLQALCHTCNTQKRDRDETDFEALHRSYEDRVASGVFCEPPREILEQNELAYVIADGYAVTKGHSLIIPQRHVSDYFDLYMAERNAVERFLDGQRKRVCEGDESISSFNIGLNVGVAAGQTIFQVPMHLIPRRTGDVRDPRGGVRHVIPGKGDYMSS
jgi:diadenosine tetraphosphate (Ap4A) HIT family hydrolase